MVIVVHMCHKLFYMCIMYYTIYIYGTNENAQEKNSVEDYMYGTGIIRIVKIFF